MSPRNRLDRAAYVLAIWFGCGLSPRAPGTVGTLGALPLYWLLSRAGPLAVGLTAFGLTLAGIWACGRVARQTGLPDSQVVVIDEVAGVLTALAIAGPALSDVGLAVLTFRVLDIWKPGPIRYLERNLPGGFGIMLDDIAAGALAGALVWTLHAVS